jgi:hypothetical protein
VSLSNLSGFSKMPNEFLWTYQTAGDARPSASTYGTVVTPGNNTMGSWAELTDGANVTEDVWLCGVVLQSNGTAVIRDTLVDIGIDPSAGTSYSVLIPYLALSHASGYTGGGVTYDFPLHIPAGSSIAARASVNNATVGTLYVWMRLWGRPTRPDATAKGTFIEAIGIVTGSSRGTTVTPGTTSEGSWTSLGSTVNNLWYWQMGQGMADASVSSSLVAGDLSVGDGSNKRVVIEEHMLATANNDYCWNVNLLKPPPVAVVKAGTTVYARLQHAGTADTGHWVAAYGVGGG